MGEEESTKYHHGDLRRALVDAATRLVEAGGAFQASLRAIAREAGVSAAAPYHHFADRDALLAAVATEGFDGLRDSMKKGAASASDEDPLDRLQAAGIAYVTYAVENPEIFRLMFSGLLAERNRYAELETAASSAFVVLSELLQTDGRVPTGTASQGGATPSWIALASWSTVHGLAFLLIDGMLDDDRESFGTDEIARQVTRVLGRGLMSVKALGDES